MEKAEIIWETLVQASERKGKLEKIDFAGVLDTEHIQIVAQKQGKEWQIYIYPKDEIGKLIENVYHDLERSEALTRQMLEYVLDYILTHA